MVGAAPLVLVDLRLPACLPAQRHLLRAGHRCCSVRHAIKIALAADQKNLRAERVDFDAVERRLLDILAGEVNLTQVPDTVRGSEEQG